MNNSAAEIKAQGIALLSQVDLSEDYLKEYCFLRRVAMYTHKQARMAMGISKYQGEMLESVTYGMDIRFPQIDKKTRKGIVDRMFESFLKKDTGADRTDAHRPSSLF